MTATAELADVFGPRVAPAEASATAPRANGHVHRWQSWDAAKRELGPIHHRVDAADGKRIHWTGIHVGQLADLVYGGEVLVEAPAEATILVCEGEKAADAARRRGVPFAVGTVCGAAATRIWSPAVAELFRGRHVVLWPDNDDVGRIHMHRVAAVLAGIAATIRWVDWRDGPAGGDAADWVDADRDPWDAIDASGALPDPEPQPVPPPRAPRRIQAVPEFTPGEVDEALVTGDAGGAMTFTADRGIFRAAWAAPRFVEIAFDLVRLERSGDITAEGTIRSTLQGAERILHRARVNLSGTRSRSELANHLAKRAKGQGLEWPDLLEEAILATIEAFRAGEPAILLRDAERPAGAGYVLPPVLLGAHPTMLFGDGGTGKSFLALGMALTLHQGDPLLGLEPARRLRVGYFDWEFSGWDHRERARLLGATDPDLLYVRCRGPLTEEVDRLRGIIAREQLDYVVLDSVAYACDGPPEASDVAMRFFQALGRLELGSLLIAHVPKDADTDKPFGSAFWHNSARATWYVAKQQDLGASAFTVGLFNRKANTGPQAAPLGYRFDFDADRVRITRTDLLEVPELAEQIPVKTRMRRALRAGAMTPIVLAEEIGASVDAIRMVVTRDKGSTFTRVAGPDGVERLGLVSHAVA